MYIDEKYPQLLKNALLYRSECISVMISLGIISLYHLDPALEWKFIISTIGDSDSTSHDQNVFHCIQTDISCW